MIDDSFFGYISPMKHVELRTARFVALRPFSTHYSPTLLWLCTIAVSAFVGHVLLELPKRSPINHFIGLDF